LITSPSVYLKQVSSSIEIKCQESRSFEDNRYLARVRLCEKRYAIVCNEKTKEQQINQNQKPQNKRRSRRSKPKMLDEKSKQGPTKKPETKTYLSRGTMCAI
jgi:hypothetical protein